MHFLIKKEKGGYPFRGRKIEEASEGEIVTEIAFPFFFFPAGCGWRQMSEFLTPTPLSRVHNPPPLFLSSYFPSIVFRRRPNTNRSNLAPPTERENPKITLFLSPLSFVGQGLVLGKCRRQNIFHVPLHNRRRKGPPSPPPFIAPQFREKMGKINRKNNNRRGMRECVCCAVVVSPIVLPIGWRLRYKSLVLFSFLSIRRGCVLRPLEDEEWKCIMATEGLGEEEVGGRISIFPAKDDAAAAALRPPRCQLQRKRDASEG